MDLFLAYLIGDIVTMILILALNTWLGQASNPKDLGSAWNLAFWYGLVWPFTWIAATIYIAFQLIKSAIGALNRSIMNISRDQEEKSKRRAAAQSRGY